MKNPAHPSPEPPTERSSPRRLFDLALLLSAAATLVALPLPADAGAAENPMARVDGGIYRPVFPPSPAEKEIRVEPFLLDVTPVTNGAFLAFVTRHPKWRRGSVARLFADSSYLSHWEGPLSLGKEAGRDQPVVHVSWFAAKAFCEASGKRLPSESEWEFAAAADDKAVDARQDPAFTAKILGWYARPGSQELPPVGQTEPNLWGVRDLHGVVWEWVADFNNTLVSSDSRESGDPDMSRFCGAGAVSAADKNDYASFMRIAFRSSLKAPWTTANLGFRCARDVGPDDGKPGVKIPVGKTPPGRKTK